MKIDDLAQKVWEAFIKREQAFHAYHYSASEKRLFIEGFKEGYKTKHEKEV